MAFYQLHKQQHIKATIDEVWEFISSPHNLKHITPEYMGFDITISNLPKTMYPGMIITYKVRPMLRIPVKWVTEITHVEHKKYFIDEQRIGPYSLWHHQHILQKVEDGVLMTDIVSYKPPLGLLGALANALFIRKKLEAIFTFRKSALEKRFVV